MLTTFNIVSTIYITKSFNDTYLQLKSAKDLMETLF